MTHNRNQWNRAQVYWAKKTSHDDDAPSSSRNAPAREPTKGDAWNNWGEAGAVENQGACWNVPLKFEGANREEYRVVFDWDDSAAKEAYYSPVEPTVQDYLADCERYSAQIDWETRRSCNLPECAEVMTREENKRKGKGNYTRHENTRVGSPVIIGLPTGRDIDGNDCAVSSIHLPLFAVPPATGWGDEGDVVPAPTGWDEENTAPPAPTGWDNKGDLGVHTASGWDDKKECAPQKPGWDGEWFGHGSATLVQIPGVPGWAEVAARPAVPERAEVTAWRGPSRWAEVAARPTVSERAGVASENQVSGGDSTIMTLASPGAFGWQPVGPAASGLEDFSHAHDPVNAGWMQCPTFPNNPESYKHIVPSGWGDVPEEGAPTPDVEMNPDCCNSCEDNWVALNSPRSSRYVKPGCDASYGSGNVHQEKQRHGSSGPIKYGGSEYWKLKESEPRNNFEPHYRKNPQRSGRSPIANNLRVNQDSKPSRGNRWDRAKTSVWQAACALSHDERTSLIRTPRV